MLIYRASAPCKCTIATVLHRQLLVRQDIIDYNAIFDHIHIYSIDQQARPNSHVQQQDIAHQQTSRNHPTRVTGLVRFYNQCAIRVTNFHKMKILSTEKESNICVINLESALSFI